MIEEICKNCKFWGSEKMTLWGKEVDHFRICRKAEIKMYTSEDSNCYSDIKGFEAKYVSDIH